MYLQLKGITKDFASKRVVDNLSLDIYGGEFLTLLGPSGCGKTTVLKMIGGFLPPTLGQIVLDGRDITVLPPEDRPVTTVFQNYALFPHMTVMENVLYGLRYQPGYEKKEAQSRGRDILALVNLLSVEDRNVGQLSGGQQQRVALARAVVMNPKVLLLDEPFSNLDAKLRYRIRREIQDIQQKLGITMIFVTHDQEEALSLSDRIVVMQEGRAEQVGTPREIYCHPANGFVADFIGRANRLEINGISRMVRPENVFFATADAPSDYQGVVAGKQYMGSYTVYFVRVGESIVEVDVRLGDDLGWDIGQVINLCVTGFIENS